METEPRKDRGNSTAGGFSYGIADSHKCAALRSTNSGVTIAIYRQLAEPTPVGMIDQASSD